MLRKILIAAALALAGAATVNAQQAPTEYPGCEYVASPGTLSDKQTARCQMDTNKNIKTVTSGSSSTPLLPDLTATASVTSATTLFTTDTSGYAVASIQFTSVGSGNTVSFEESADNVTWIATAATINYTASANGQLSATSVAPPLTTASYVVILRMRYFRARVSTYGSGTVTAFVTYKVTPVEFMYQSTPGDSGTDAAGATVNARQLTRGPIGWEMQRSVFPNTMFSSAARTASSQTSDVTNQSWRGLLCVINVTSVTDTPSVVFTIQGKDSVSNVYFTHLASAAIVGTGTTVLRVYPGLTAAANLVANDVLARTWRVDATHADADSITYSMGCNGIP